MVGRPNPSAEQRPGVEEVPPRQAVAEMDRFPGIQSEHDATLNKMTGGGKGRGGSAGLGQASILIRVSDRVKGADASGTPSPFGLTDPDTVCQDAILRLLA